MRNLLITGGAGFIGSNYVRYVLQNHVDLNVVVFDKLTYAGNLDNLRDIDEQFRLRYRFVKGDICDAGAVSHTLREYQIDTIVNFAAESHVDRSLLTPDAFIKTDVNGNWNLDIDPLSNFDGPGSTRIHDHPCGDKTIVYLNAFHLPVTNLNPPRSDTLAQTNAHLRSPFDIPPHNHGGVGRAVVRPPGVKGHVFSINLWIPELDFIGFEDLGLDLQRL